MKTVRIGNTDWSCEERGAGPAVVLIHGFPLDRHIWDDQLAGLSSRFRLIAVDLKGFGQSRSTEAFTIDSLADDLAQFIRLSSAAPCVLAGLSMGGYVAFSLAASHPEVLKGLVIVCSKSEADTTQAKEGRQKMAQTAQSEGSKPVADTMMPKMFCENTYKNRPDLVAKLRGIMEACPPNTIANACFAMRDRVDRTPDLPNLPMPVLVVLGEKDVIIPSEMGAKMAGACKQGEFVLIKGAGHLAPMEEPAAVNEAIAAFAGRVA